MERAVIQSDLIKNDIQPDHLINQYQSLLKDDIRTLLPENSLEEAICPKNDNSNFGNSFLKFGMQYKISTSLHNIYLSPRPSMNDLKKFYLDSKARKFWLSVLWPKTKIPREEKIIHPQLEWVQGFISQYFNNSNLILAEYLPNHWGYQKSSKHFFPNHVYRMIDILFDYYFLRGDKEILENIDSHKDNSIDIALLFEALDRSPDPSKLLLKVKQALKPGGLGFVTCLLSSGFEVQVLGEKSDIFVPPERMNLFSFEGLNALIKNTGDLEILEFSTPAVLDIPNVINKIDELENPSFFNYLFKLRNDPTLTVSFQHFLQLNRLGTFARIVLRKNNINN